MSAKTKYIIARISGHVQGVNYRSWTRDRAQEHGLSGWVRNEDDGTVHAFFQGPADKVDDIVSDLWHGPHAARVEAVDIDAVDPADIDLAQGGDFTIRR